MTTFNKIKDQINSVKKWNQEAGNELHNQFEVAQSSNWETLELKDYILSENDVADDHYNDDDSRHAEIREIQHSIINFFGE